MKVQVISEETLHKMVFPILLTPELFTEPGANVFYDELFGQKFTNKESDAPLTSKKYYVEFILAFIEQLFMINQFEVRLNLLILFNGFIDNLIFMNKDPDREELLSCSIAEVFFGRPLLLIGIEDVDDEICIN